MEAKRHREDAGHRTAKTNSHRRKTTSQFRNARGLALRSKSAPRENKTHCSFCKEGGALLPCDKCTRSFHLVCLNMRESEVPAVAWFCTFCSYSSPRPHKEKKLREETARRDKEQKAKKDASMKQTLNKLSTSQKDQAVRRFSKKHPQYIRQGRIQYPIEDTLLALDPLLHQITVPPPIPRPHLINFPAQALGDLLYIADYFTTFHPVLLVSLFTTEQLHVALTAQTHSCLLKEMLMSLVDLVMRHLLDRENATEAFGPEAAYSRLIYAMKEYVQLPDFLPYVYLLICKDVLHAPVWHDLVEEGSSLDQLLTQKLPEYPLDDYFYTDYAYSEKVEILLFLISCTYDCKDIHEELTHRLEAKAQLQKDKHDTQSEIKALETKKSDAKPGSRAAQTLTDQIAIQQKKLESIAMEASELKVRTSPIGLDRDYNEYYAFKFDRHRVYVKWSLPMDSKRVRDPCESGYWYFYSAKTDLASLQHSLCSKGQRESKLLEGLNFVKSRLLSCDPEGDSTSSEVPQDLETDVLMQDDYVNTDSRYETTEDLFVSVKVFLQEVETRFSDYLRRSAKCWELDQGLGEWRSAVEAAKDVEDLRPLLIDFVSKSKTPFKQKTLGEDDSEDKDEDEECVYERKYRKVTLRIWQDLGDINQQWLDLLSLAQSRSEISCLIGLLNGVLLYYMKRKPEALPTKPKPQMKPSGVRTRLAIRIENKKNNPRSDSPSSSDSHDSVCLLCQDAGELILCEGCPRVVHPECIGLTVIPIQTPPEEDWYCDSCQRTRDTCRITRSRTRLRKIGN